MNTKGRDYVRVNMPLLGLGTWQVRSSDIPGSLDAALSAGYRFIDTAQIYGNEAAIGKALKELLPKYNLSRENIFITSKLAPGNQGSVAEDSIQKSLENLQSDYIDLFIIHWPGSSNRSESPKNAALRRQSWETMEKLHEQGKLRAIGVSNYLERHLEELLSHTKVLPAVDQCEYHVHYQTNDLVNYCKDKGIHFQSYSTLGSPDGRKKLMNDPKVVTLAEKYKISVPVLLLAWAINQEISVLPRSTKKDHIEENFKALQIQMDPADVQSLLSNDAKSKYCWEPNSVV
ncbi:unnamed protein product, partial [Mesorhabditis belari]|uniref:NADP-dependent oxidoreductase domain-containing protein n=1 Tax=Mesorhabditis belari TaxID=2138241 RepID=A0AAF3FSK5_9BILA